MGIMNTVRAQGVRNGTTKAKGQVEVLSSGKREKKKRKLQGNGAQGASRLRILNLFL